MRQHFLVICRFLPSLIISKMLIEIIVDIIDWYYSCVAHGVASIPGYSLTSLNIFKGFSLFQLSDYRNKLFLLNEDRFFSMTRCKHFFQSIHL